MLALKFLALLIFLAYLIGADCELFESENEFQELVDLETKFIGEFETFVASQKKNVEFLERKLKYYKKENEEAQKDPEYLSNVLNTYLLTQRLSTGIETIENRSLSVLESFFAVTQKIYEVNSIKSLNDKQSEIVGDIIHYQESNGLDTTVVASGSIDGKKRDPLEARDIFDLAFTMSLMNEGERAIEWFQESLDHLETEEDPEVSKLEIYESMVANFLNLNKTLEAISLNKEILHLDPNNQRALEMESTIREILGEEDLIAPVDFDDL